MNIFGRQYDLPFFTEEWLQEGEKHRFVYTCVSRTLFAAKHSRMTLRMGRPLFLGSYLQIKWWAFGQWKGRKICIKWWTCLLIILFYQSSPFHSFQVLLKMLKPSWQLTQWKQFFKVKHQCIHMRHHQFSPNNINMVNGRGYHARTNSLIFKQVLLTILIL